MDIDPDNLNWMLEFLLKEPLDDSTLNSLVGALHIPNNYHFQKSFLLRKFESQIAHNSSLSETTLDFLEILEQVEFDRGIEEVSDAMKNAYCQVAVECTVKYLRNEDGEDNKGKFCEAVESVWRGRVRKMEKVEKGGLCSEELFTWRDEIDNAVSNKRNRKRLVKKSEGVNAAEALRVYVKEERERMGPSFLELVVLRFKDVETMKLVLGLGNANGIAPKEPILHGADPDLAVKNNNKEVQKDASLRRSSATPRGAEIADSDCLEVQPLHSEFDLPPTPEVIKVQEALESSRVDLQENVKDPLPDALRCAEAITGKARGSMDHEPIQENHVSPNPSPVNSAGVVRTNGGNPRNGARPSLMERNSTAHTLEWDESIEDSSEESADRGSRPKLPSPKRRSVSPLNKYEPKQMTKRRRVGKWSTFEEDTLREGVEKYGEGQWKRILEDNPHIFEDGRTPVDLKDKWRNMKRY